MVWYRFSRIPGGSVQCLLYPPEASGQPWLSRLTLETGELGRLITQTWERIPFLETVQAQMVEKLAEMALAVWPQWYDASTTPSFQDLSSLDDWIDNQFSLERFIHLHPDISKPWLMAAIPYCLNGQAPFLDRISLSIQASQLALAVSGGRLLFVLLVEDYHPQQGHLLGFIKSAEWLAHHTTASVALLLPEELAASSEAEAVLYQVISLEEELSAGTAEREEDENKLLIWPVKGKPHPFSPGEQKMAKALSLDPDLRNLFGFNQPIVSTRHHSYWVDLLWQEGRVVVEIDGYRHHGNQYAFYQDRHRDYELTISGYTVLRLTHEEVMHDTALALEKIRDLVSFRRQSMHTERIPS